MFNDFFRFSSKGSLFHNAIIEKEGRCLSWECFRMDYLKERERSKLESFSNIFIIFKNIFLFFSTIGIFVQIFKSFGF